MGEGFLKKKKAQLAFTSWGVRVSPGRVLTEHSGFNIPAKFQWHVSLDQGCIKSLHMRTFPFQQNRPFPPRSNYDGNCGTLCRHCDSTKKKLLFIASKQDEPSPHTDRKRKKNMYNVEKEIYSHSLYNSGLYIIYFLNCKNQSKTRKTKEKLHYLTNAARKNKVQNSSFPFVILTFRPSKKKKKHFNCKTEYRKIDGAQTSVHNGRNQSSHLSN